MNRLIASCALLCAIIFSSLSFASISEEIKDVVKGQLSEATDAGQMAIELSQLTSMHLYNLNEAQLDQTLLVMLKTNRRLQAVRIIDYATQEVIASIYRNDSESFIHGDFPDNFNQYQMAKATIYHNGVPIGLSEIRFLSAEEISRLDALSNNLITLVIAFSVFFALTAILFRLLSKNLGGNAYLTFGTQKFARLIFCAISAFILISIAGSWLILEHNRSNILQRSADAFHQYLRSLDRSLANLHMIREKTFRHIFNKPEFQRNLHELSNAVLVEDDVAVNYYRNKMAEVWANYREFSLNGSKLIVAPDLSVIYSQGQALDLNDILSAAPDKLAKPLIEQSELIPIQVSYDSSTGNTDYRLIFATPVFDSATDTVIAIAMIEIDEQEISYNDLSMHDFSSSGEVLVFDGDGQMLSKPRFALDPSRVEHERIFIQEMLHKLKVHGLANNLAGIHKVIDYRGVPTYAMLNWNDNLNVALVAKMDVDEILNDYYLFRKSVLFVVFIMVLFTVPCLLFTLYAGSLTNQRLKDSRREIINRLGHAAEFKDNETALHIFRMSRYTEVLARNLKMSSDWIELLCDAAPMHDIGKIGVPDNILQKPGKLDPEEWEVMKKHPKFGADIIGQHADSTLLNTAREIALYHHEKWDGTGYPEGISGENIPLSARIVAIADVFDALTSSRPYKKAWAFEDAINLILSESGRHFDPKLVKVFTESLTEFKFIMKTYSDETLEKKAS